LTYSFRILFSLLISLVFFISACENSTDYRFKKGSVLTDSLNQERFIIQKQFDTKRISDTIQVVHKDSIIGVWTDSIMLVREDGKWHGMKPIDKKINLSLFKSSKYEWKEKHSYSKLDTVSYGQYWISNYNDSSFLQLRFNHVGDTLFNHGDTIFSNNYLIDYFNNDKLWIRSYDSKNNTTHNEAYLMIRKKK